MCFGCVFSSLSFFFLISVVFTAFFTLEMRHSSSKERREAVVKKFGVKTTLDVLYLEPFFRRRTNGVRTDKRPLCKTLLGFTWLVWREGSYGVSYRYVLWAKLNVHIFAVLLV